MCAARLRSCKPETRASGSKNYWSTATIGSSRESIPPRYERATSRLLRSPERPGSKMQSGPWSRSGLLISSGLQDRLPPPRLLVDVVPLGGGARLGVGARQLCGLAEGLGDRLLVERVDEDSGLRRYELGWTADLRPDDRAAAGHPLEQRLAEGLDEAWLADDVGLGDQPGNTVVGDGPEQAHFVAPLELGA